MIRTLFVPKTYGNCADPFLTLGLANLVEFAQRQTENNPTVQLIDAGSQYRLELQTPLDIDAIARIEYANPFPPVVGAKTEKKDQLPAETPVFNAVEQKEIRKQYRDYLYQSGGKPEWEEDAPKPADPRTQNATLLTAMRHDRNHNRLWLEAWKLRDSYGLLLASIFRAYSQPSWEAGDRPSDRAAQSLKKENALKLPNSDSAVKVYQPTAVEGMTRVKTDAPSFKSQKENWLNLWLIASGFFHFALSEQVKIAEKKYDWRTVALCPQDISLAAYRQVLDRLRQYNPPGGGHGIARFDAELVLKLARELLDYHAAKAQDTPSEGWDIWQRSLNRFVSRFHGTHFGSKGQVYGVQAIFSLGLPSWISPENYNELLDYQQILDEHLAVIRGLSAEAGHAELLNAYRDFITGNSLTAFFPFQVKYADYLVKKLADPHAPNPRQFSKHGLDLMSKKDVRFTQITQDPSFLRIAKAINQATVHAGRIQTRNGEVELDWQRNYGLAQQLSSQSGSKKDFVCAIADFLAKYENENLRISEDKNKTLKRVWPTKDDLDRLIELIDEFDTVLVANLLVAYGYARWHKPKSDAASEPAEAAEEIEVTPEDF
ncbi:hypothetical protein [Geitlerinema sp. PCC 9228]|uniref:hypothetical protein n=1 Tax=Geitlerinema sp. PCC 9228 TaxID=111611 RepID=UPI0008F99955|nr:hypothetical protein [Geitlerinema sp. PCC 9228]